MRSLLSRLAREVSRSAYPGSFPAFAVADSVGLLAWRNCAARSSRPFLQAVARAEFLPPYSRASATVLHRLPGTESAFLLMHYSGAGFSLWDFVTVQSPLP